MTRNTLSVRSPPGAQVRKTLAATNLQQQTCFFHYYFPVFHVRSQTQVFHHITFFPHPLDSGAGLEAENGVSLRRYDSGIGDDHTSAAASEGDLSAASMTHGPDAISEALSTLSSEVKTSLPADSKGKNVKDILRSLVSAPSDDVTVDPGLLPPSFLGSVSDISREPSQQFRSFDR